MGFSSAKRALLAALEAGNFQHEAREVLSEKNLLAVGDVSVDEVIGIVRRARGTDYSASPHHWDPGDRQPDHGPEAEEALDFRFGRKVLENQAHAPVRL